jgi:hypothetical protein
LWKIRLKTFLNPGYVWYHSDADSKFLTAREISMPVNSANCADMLFMICFIFLFYYLSYNGSRQLLSLDQQRSSASPDKRPSRS